jgi:hypothetical protein
VCDAAQIACCIAHTTQRFISYLCTKKRNYPNILKIDKYSGYDYEKFFIFVLENKNDF